MHLRPNGVLIKFSWARNWNIWSGISRWKSRDPSLTLAKASQTNRRPSFMFSRLCVNHPASCCAHSWPDSLRSIHFRLTNGRRRKSVARLRTIFKDCFCVRKLSSYLFTSALLESKSHSTVVSYMPKCSFLFPLVLSTIIIKENIKLFS